MLEEPTVRGFPLDLNLLYTEDYEDVLKFKYPNYKRKSGFHSRISYWAAYT